MIIPSLFFLALAHAPLPLMKHYIEYLLSAQTFVINKSAAFLPIFTALLPGGLAAIYPGDDHSNNNPSSRCTRQPPSPVPKTGNAAAGNSSTKTSCRL